MNPKQKVAKKKSPKSKVEQVSIEEFDGKDWLCVPCLENPKQRYRIALAPIRMLIANYDREKSEAWRKQMVV